MGIFELSAPGARQRATTQLTTQLFDDSPLNSETTQTSGTDNLITDFFHSANIQHKSKSGVT